MAGSTRVDYTHVETYPPYDFPNNEPGLITYHETFNLDRIACHISRYEDLEPSQLFYSEDGVWTSSPIFPNYDDNLFVEVGFTYSATVYETTNSFSGVIEFVFGPPLLPTFELSPGDDYPSSLQFGAIRTIRSESKTILPTVGLPFTLTASFASVPEPSTLSIATLAAATLAIVLRTKIARQS
ncbi:MAG: hypothetical protein SGJ19_04090 [Planctomycetia bacterium]|nr:hypothetical protein [Planctomycetia bacterium]